MFVGTSTPLSHGQTQRGRRLGAQRPVVAVTNDRALRRRSAATAETPTAQCRGSGGSSMKKNRWEFFFDGSVLEIKGTTSMFCFGRCSTNV